MIAADAILLKSGATASVNIEFFQLGMISGEMAGDILSGKAKPQDMPISFYSQRQSKTSGYAHFVPERIHSQH